MIYAYSVMKGYHMILGNLVLQLALALVTMFFVEVPIGLEYAIGRETTRLYYTQIIVHVLVAINSYFILEQTIWKHMELVTNFVAIFLTIVSFFLFMELFRTLTALADGKELGPIQERADDFIFFQFWVQIEILVVITIAISNIIFVANRFFFDPKLSVQLVFYEEKFHPMLKNIEDEDEKSKVTQQMREGQDFLYVTSQQLNYFVTHSCPAFIFITILSITREDFNRVELVTVDLLDDDKKSMVTTLAILASIQAFGTLCLIYNPFDRKTLTANNKCFWLLSQVFFYGSNAIAIFVPLVVFTYCGVLWNSNDIPKSFIKVPLIFYLMVAAFDYIPRTLQSVYLTIGKYQYDSEQAREKAEIEAKKAAGEEVDETPEKELPYEDQRKFLGSGSIRVGSFLDLGEDIYSMLFVSCLYSDYINYQIAVADTDHDLKDDELAELKESQNAVVEESKLQIQESKQEIQSVNEEKDQKEEEPFADSGSKGNGSTNNLGSADPVKEEKNEDIHFLSNLNKIEKSDEKKQFYSEQLDQLIRTNVQVRQEKMDLTSQVLMTWFFQFIIFYLIQRQNRDIPYGEIPMPTYEVAFARYIAGLMMHIAMMGELKEGLGKIKFALNHHWRFRFVTLAVTTGFLQSIMIVIVTCLNYYVIIAKSLTVIDVTKDFLAMMIIADFDNFVFVEHAGESILKQIVMSHQIKKLNIFRIQTTTSKYCVVADEKNPDLNKLVPLKSYEWIANMRQECNYPALPFPNKSMKIQASDRTCSQKVLFFLYRLMRFLYLSFWFYFSPLLFTMFQFFLPLYVLHRDGALPSGASEKEAPTCGA